MTLPEQFEPGKLLDNGRYKIVGLLGTGGQARVYLAEDTGIEKRLCALKAMQRTTGGFDAFQREKLAGKLNHDGIVKLYAQFTHGEIDCLVMEYINGVTLEGALKSGVMWDRPSILRIIRQVAEALDHAHRLGIVHRDIKPANIILTKDGTAKITDFGAARRQSGATFSTQTASQTVIIGTGPYMSPEQLGGTPPTGASDQWSLAVMTHEAMTRNRPFVGATRDALTRAIVNGEYRLDASSLAPPALGVFERAFSGPPLDRFSTCVEFVNELELALKPPVVYVDVREKEPKPPRESPRYRWLALAACALSALILLGVFTEPLWVGLFNRLISPVTNARDQLQYVWIPAGHFGMGCSPNDSDCDGDEAPHHEVAISRGFWISTTETTVGAYELFTKATSNPMPPAPDFNPNWKDKNHPIVNVSWNQATSYCEWAGDGRLPTEAEWEYAARGGKDWRYPWGDTITHENANYGADKGSAGATGGRDKWEFTSPVGSFDPNGYGMYDMAGNVAEWVRDWYGDSYYKGAPGTDPRGPADGKKRMLRGGSWYNSPRWTRVSYRTAGDPEDHGIIVGFRCVLRDSSGTH